jgi:hypothetical protein
MNSYKKWIGMIASLLLSGCQIPAAMIATGAGAMPAYEALPEPNYDALPQVIYAIDKNRFFTSENYQECSVGHVYYNDTNNKIKTLVGNALATFPGHLLVDGSSNILVFPTAPANGVGWCGNDKGCTLIMYYSLDGGRTFDWFHPWQLSSDLKESYEIAKSLTVTLKGKQLYVQDKESAYMFALGKGTMGASEYIKDGPKAVPHVRTPSGQDHLICDDSIHPKEIKK